MTVRFRTIDESIVGDHYHLREDDVCLYLLEFTSRQGYSFSKANQLIANLKKKPTASAAELEYKRAAINMCAQGLRDALDPDWLARATLVPIPGSKAAGHPHYDDRMGSVARLIRPGQDVRPLVRQTVSLTASHEAEEGARASVTDLIEAYEIDETLAAPAPKAIGILDDVLTAGAHYRAMHTLLSRRFPGVPITGLFIARRVFAA